MHKSEGMTAGEAGATKKLYSLFRRKQMEASEIRRHIEAAQLLPKAILRSEWDPKNLNSDLSPVLDLKQDRQMLRSAATKPK